MKQDLFTNLPLEMKLEILSRLSIGSVFKCKLVDRSWRSLIESPEFAKSYKSAPCLAFFEEFDPPAPLHLYKVCEVEDRDAESKNTCKEAFNFNFPHRVPLHTSVKGLLLMRDYYWDNHSMYVCNPVTREYITITSPKYKKSEVNDNYGFGVSRNSGLFKVVRIFDHLTNGKEEEEEGEGEEEEEESRVGCQVYTVGTGLWRSVAHDNESLLCEDDTFGVFLNGNFHWPASDKEGDSWISCFDLETELFTTLHAPCPPCYDFIECGLLVVRDCLCICEYSSKDEVVIWLMKNYGDDKSWTKVTKQFVFPGHQYDDVIHIFNNGDILLKGFGKRTLCYSNETKAIEETDLIKLHEDGFPKLLSYTPSFLPLKTFSLKENVRSF